MSSWGKAPQIIAMIEPARSQGQKITADQYPYLASGGSVASIPMPRWMLEGGRNDTLKRLDDPAQIGRIRGEMFELLNNRGGGKNLLVIRPQSPWLGKTLEDIAKAWRLPEVEAAIRVYKEGDEVRDFRYQRRRRAQIHGAPVGHERPHAVRRPSAQVRHLRHPLR